KLESQAIPGETYRLALTPSLVSRIFGNRVTDATLVEGGYVQLAGSGAWWIRSGRVFFSLGDADTAAQELAAAHAHFWQPRRAGEALALLADPLVVPGAILAGASSRLVYDLFAYQRTRDVPQPAPPVVYTLLRETHLSDLGAGELPRFQHVFSYSDGLGRESQ